MSVTSQIAMLAIQLGLIIFAAKFFGRLAQKISIPPVLGELLAGILIGPYLLGGVDFGLPGFEHGFFPLLEGASLPVSVPLYSIATLGSIMLLFMSGLETDLRMFFRYSVVGTVVGLGGVIFSFVFGAVLGMLLLHAPFMDPRCLFLGILSTATSVGITARILSEKKSIDSPEGTTILAAAVIDDVLGIICLAIVMGIVGGMDSGKVNWSGIGIIAVKSVGIWLGVTAVGLTLAHKIAGFLKLFRTSAVFALLSFGLALLLAGFFEQAGLAMIVGAYVMGLSLSKTDISFSIQRHLQGVYEFLVPIFFVVMGMLVDVRVMTDSHVLKFGLIYSLLAVFAKVIGCALPAFFMNFNWLGSLRIGAGMVPRGEVALIIAGIGATTMMKLNGAEVPIINSKLFGVAIIMTLVTTLAAPPLLSFVLSLKGSGVRKQTRDDTAVHTEYDFQSEAVSSFVLHLLIANFRAEGYRHSDIYPEGGLTHFRRGSTTFTLHVEGNHFDFESAQSEVILIKTVVYETVVDLYRTVGKLRELTLPDAFDQAVMSDLKTLPTPASLGSIHFDAVVPPGCIDVDLKAQSLEDAISELTGTLSRNGHLADPDKCLFDVLARESIVSTCVADQVAFPHARTSGTKKMVAAVGISRNGFKEFKTSGHDLKVVVLILCPPEEDKPYLQFVAAMATRLGKKEIYNSIASSDNTSEIRSLLNGKKKV